MTTEERRERLISLEWEEFQQVHNRGGRADCQDDPKTFFHMRRSQYCAWTDELLDSFTQDLEDAAANRRNLLSEKYAWMMESTFPEEFAAIKHALKEPDAESKDSIRAIMEIYKEWTAEYVRKYPAIASGGRPAESSSDDYGTSIETYQRGELMTYSARTLKLFLEFVQRLKGEGKNLALLIVEDSMKRYGFRDLEDAEAVLSREKQA